MPPAGPIRLQSQGFRPSAGLHRGHHLIGGAQRREGGRVGRDCSGVVAQAIDEPCHWNEVDHGSNGYRQQPGDRHLPARMPASRSLPCTHGGAGTASLWSY